MMKALLVIAGTVVLQFALIANAAAADAERGAKLHQDCLGCHGTELYVPPRAKVKSLSALRKEVVRWNDRMNPKFTNQEVDDLVAWLNRDFYKFPK